MTRIVCAGRILKALPISSVLDIGCRDGSLADELPSATYSGADLCADGRGRVKYVGDVTQMEITGVFDAVVALDILEHLPHPSAMFDRLVGMASRYLLVSFPNTYDLKSRARFFFQGRMGGKYKFLEEEPRDRHHWLISRAEAIDFFHAKAAKHHLSFQTYDMRYGQSGRRSLTSFAGRIASRVLPASLATETVFGLFCKNGERAAKPSGSAAS
jgi:hypothetical protein